MIRVILYVVLRVFIVLIVLHAWARCVTVCVCVIVCVDFSTQVPEPVSVTNPMGDKLTDTATVQTIKFALRRQVALTLDSNMLSDVREVHIPYKNKPVETSGVFRAHGAKVVRVLSRPGGRALKFRRLPEPLSGSSVKLR